MGDNRRYKNKSTNEGFKKAIGFFEITRPNRNNKNNLQRTNSLPLGKKSLEDEDNVSTKSWVRGSKGKVQKIKKKIEDNSEQAGIKALPITAKQRIKDVTKEIEYSNTELEIAHDKLSEESSGDSSSLNTVLSGISGTTVKEVSEPSVEEDETFTTNYGYVSDNRKRHEGHNSFAVQPLLRLPDADQPEKFDPMELWNHNTPLTLHNQRPISDDLCTETGKVLEPPVQPGLIEGDELSPALGNEQNLEIDSIQWWKHKTFVHTSDNDTTPESPQESSSGRFIKNPTRASSRSRKDRRRTGVIQKPFSVLELTRHFEGFKDAAEKGQTESFRQSFICQMDQELENMKNDGFEEDFYLSLENLHLDENVEEDSNADDRKWEEEFGKSLLLSIENKAIQTNSSNERNLQGLAGYSRDEEDPFGEISFDDGLFFLEAYNMDYKELVECTVQLDRRSVDLQSFDKIQQSPDLLAQNIQGLLVMNDVEQDPESKRKSVYSTTSADDSGTGSESKRNTIYSTTSGDSFEDEDIPESGSSVVNYGPARRETYCDDQGRVRIERVAPYGEKQEEAGNYVNTSNHYYETADEEVLKQEAKDEEDHEYEIIRLEHDFHVLGVAEVKKDAIQYILDEIVSTERKYLTDIEQILRDYKDFLDERCPEKSDVVFGNMEQIYFKQLEFLQALEASAGDVQLIVEAFIDFEDLFRLYPRYFRNTPKANAAVKELNFLLLERQKMLQHKLNLSSYLVTPIQRLGKYKLFLENIIKQLEKEDKPSDHVQNALHMVKKFLSRGNDSVAIASILRSPLHTKDYGSFIAREKFFMAKPKKMDVVVFLFDGAVVFAQEDSNAMEQFEYLQSIKTNDLRIATFDHDCTIHLTDFTKTKRRNSSKYTYVLDAKSSKLKEAWKKLIEDILWQQMQKLKEETLKRTATLTPTLPSLPRRTPVRSREERAKTTGSSVFYVE